MFPGTLSGPTEALTYPQGIKLGEGSLRLLMGRRNLEIPEFTHTAIGN